MLHDVLNAAEIILLQLGRDCAARRFVDEEGKGLPDNTAVSPTGKCLHRSCARLPASRLEYPSFRVALACGLDWRFRLRAVSLSPRENSPSKRGGSVGVSGQHVSAKVLRITCDFSAL